MSLQSVGYLEVLSAKDQIASNFGYVIVALSFVFFYFNTLYGILPRVAPKSARTTEQQLWKWRNTANSLIHSTISGVWSILSFFQTPAIRENLVDVYTYSTITIISISIGYFIYDFVDMALNSRSRSTNELLFHHFLVIICFGIPVVNRYYVGYAMVALLVEINSIFLHIRQLLIIQGFKKEETIYRVVSIFNVATFIVFRLITLAWLIQWLAFHRDLVPVSVLFIGYTTNGTLLTLSSIMFLRILNKDFFIPQEHKKTPAKVEYGIVHWAGAAESNMDRVLVLQKRAVRVLARLSYRESCRGAFTSLGLLTIPSLYIFDSVMYIVNNGILFLLKNCNRDSET